MHILQYDRAKGNNSYSSGFEIFEIETKKEWRKIKRIQKNLLHA